jgi:hypothetical protein
MIGISEICEVSANVNFVSEGQITQPPTVTVGQGVAKRN